MANETDGQPATNVDRSCIVAAARIVANSFIKKDYILHKQASRWIDGQRFQHASGVPFTFNERRKIKYSGHTVDRESVVVARASDGRTATDPYQHLYLQVVPDFLYGPQNNLLWFLALSKPETRGSDICRYSSR